MEAFCRGDSPCVTTGTSSGKTLPFLAGAIDLLAKSPQSKKMLALYSSGRATFGLTDTICAVFTPPEIPDWVSLRITPDRLLVEY